MTLFSSLRSRILVASIFFALGLLGVISFTHLMVKVEAAKRAIQAEDARVAARQTDSSTQDHIGPSQPPRVSSKTPVLVELFTSEGCSSCPPADAILAHLDHDQLIPGVDVIVLGEHVDYWDHLGWKDRFSSPLLTQRQKNYQDFFHLDDIYTPQTVVNGSMQFNGTDRSSIDKAIEEAAHTAVPLQLNSVEVRGGDVRFTLENGPATHREYIRVFAALVDPADTTEVPAGENKGRTLHHAGVVQAFSMAGESWHMNQLGRHPDNPFMIQYHGQRADLNGMRLVVFAQTKPIGPILGAASCVLGPATSFSSAIDQTPFPANRCTAPSEQTGSPDSQQRSRR